MIVVVGGRASGKRTYVEGLGYGQADMADGMFDEKPVLLNLHELMMHDDRDPELIARDLADKQVVTCCEIGSGIVPLDPVERAWRERVGRTVNLLTERADMVVRLVCGIPVTLKG